MSTVPRIRSTVAVAATAACAATLSIGALAAGATSATAATPTYRAFGGGAYGSTASVGTVRSGATAAVPLCTTKIGASNSDTTAAVTLPRIGTIGAVSTNVHSTGTIGATIASIATTSTASTTLLGGLVSASAIGTRSTVSHSAAAGYATKGGATFTGLRIGGTPIATRPSIDQTVNLPGVGKVVLNHQSRDTRYGGLSLTVTAMRVYLIAGNSLGLPAGSVVVGHAQASLHLPTRHLAYGNAYGTTAQVGTTVTSGRTAPVYLPCGGSNGVTQTNTTASASQAGVLSTGVISSSSRSADTATSTTARTHSHISNVSLLGGAVKLSGVTAQSTATRTSSGISLTSAGTTVTGLTIRGQARSVTVRPNTKISIPGIGTLYLDRVVLTGQSIRVRAVELTLTQAYGKASNGTVITVGNTLAGVVK